METLIEKISTTVDKFVDIRRHLHQHPEVGFDLEKTSSLAISLLTKWGYSISERFAKTGFVATLKRGDGKKRLGIRADMDALPMQETGQVPWASTIPGRFHGCGHDGHTTMLLCAAKYIVEHVDFNGMLHLIFQPAEETLYGGKVMVADGVFEKYPCDAVFALHNMPGVPTGKVAFMPGPMMASSDTLHIEITGKGAHGAMPEMGIDATVIACYIVTALQSIVSRNVPPQQAAVVTVGSIQAGEAPNIINEKALMKLSVRSLDSNVRKMVLKRIEETAITQAKSFGGEAKVEYPISCPVLVNAEEETAYMKEVAISVVGEDRIFKLSKGYMASEDFSFMAETQPKSCYFILGNGDEPDRYPPHNPNYDFNDEIISAGAACWVRLVERYLECGA